MSPPSLSGKGAGGLGEFESDLISDIFILRMTMPGILIYF